MVIFGITLQIDSSCKAQATRTQSKKLSTGRQNKNLVARGRALFTAYQCLDCHKLAGKGCIDGITLDGVGDLRSVDFLIAQLEDPEEHIARVLPGQTSLMTAPNLSKDEVKAVVAYLKTLKNQKPKDKVQKSK